MGVGSNVEDSDFASADFTLAVLLAFDLLVALLFEDDEVLRDVDGVLHLYLAILYMSTFSFWSISSRPGTHSRCSDVDTERACTF